MERNSGPFTEFRHICWRKPKPIILLTDNKAVTRFFHTKIIPAPQWNACDYVIQFNITIAHIPGENNSTADYLWRLEMQPNDKLVLRIQEDITTKPIQVNIQSAGVAQEEQMFFTEYDDETEQQMWECKQCARECPTIKEPTITIETMSTNTVTTDTTINARLCKTNQIVAEQTKYPTLVRFLV